MTNEKQRRRRAENPAQQDWNLNSFSTGTSNRFAEDSSWPSNHNYNHQRNHHHHHPKSAPPDAPRFQYSNSDRPKNFSDQSTEQKNRNLYRPPMERTCFQCGQPGHVKAQCPSRGKSSRTQAQKPSS